MWSRISRAAEKQGTRAKADQCQRKKGLDSVVLRVSALGIILVFLRVSKYGTTWYSVNVIPVPKEMGETRVRIVAVQY